MQKWNGNRYRGVAKWKDSCASLSVQGSRFHLVLAVSIRAVFRSWRWVEFAVWGGSSNWPLQLLLRLRAVSCIRISAGHQQLPQRGFFDCVVSSHSVVSEHRWSIGTGTPLQGGWSKIDDIAGLKPKLTQWSLGVSSRQSLPGVSSLEAPTGSDSSRSVDRCAASTRSLCRGGFPTFCFPCQQNRKYTCRRTTECC